MLFAVARLHLGVALQAGDRVVAPAQGAERREAAGAGRGDGSALGGDDRVDVERRDPLPEGGEVGEVPVRCQRLTTTAPESTVKTALRGCGIP